MWYDTCRVLFFFPCPSPLSYKIYLTAIWFDFLLQMSLSAYPWVSILFPQLPCCMAFVKHQLPQCTKLHGLLCGITPNLAPQKGVAKAAMGSS